jgi:hypothetical protein
MMMMEYIDYVLTRDIVMAVILDHVEVILIERKEHNIKKLVEVDHWKEWVVHLTMMDRFHDDWMIDQIEMMVNGYHNSLIDYYYRYLFDLRMKKEEEEEDVRQVDNHHYDEDDNVLMNHFVMK